MCMYVYVYLRVSTCAYMYVRIRTWRNAYVRVCARMCAYMRERTCVRVCACSTCTYIYVRIRTCMYMYIRLRTCVRTSMHERACVCVRIITLSHRPSATVCREVAVDLQWPTARVDDICIGAAILDPCTICWQRFVCKPDCVISYGILVSLFLLAY